MYRFKNYLFFVFDHLLARWIPYISSISSYEVPNKVMYHFQTKLRFDPNNTDGAAPPTLYLAQGFSRTSRTLAYRKALAEAIERGSFMYYFNKDFLEGSFAKIEKQHSDLPIALPGDFVTLVQENQDCKNKVFNWTRAGVWSQGVVQPALVPAQLVFWNYDYKKTNEPLLRERNTHGTAAYTSREGALLRALYEVINRDGFFEYWLTGRIPKQIQIDNINEPHLMETIGWAQEQGFTVYLFNTPSSIVDFPSVYCMLSWLDTASGREYVSSGGGCEASYTHACISAIEEAVSLYHWYQKYGLKEEHPRLSLLQEKWYDRERISYYTQLGFTGVLSSWKESQHINFVDLVEKYQPISKLSVGQQITKILETLEVHGCKTIIATNSYLSNVGWYAVRVVVSNMLPMYHHLRNLPSTVTKHRGINVKNKNHHPFP